MFELIEIPLLILEKIPRDIWKRELSEYRVGRYASHRKLASIKYGSK